MLTPGERVVLCSDGVFAAAPGQAGLGHEGVIGAALRSESGSAADTVRQIHRAVLEAAGDGLRDDATVVCLAAECLSRPGRFVPDSCPSCLRRSCAAGVSQGISHLQKDQLLQQRGQDLYDSHDDKIGRSTRSTSTTSPATRVGVVNTGLFGTKSTFVPCAVRASTAARSRCRTRRASSRTRPTWTPTVSCPMRRRRALPLLRLTRRRGQFDWERIPTVTMRPAPSGMMRPARPPTTR